MSEKDFFISYASADRQWAKWLAWQLEEAKYTVVIQDWDFRPGSNYVAEMDRAAKEARTTLVVLSPAFFNSHFTEDEWTVAFARRALLPVRIIEFDVEGLLSVCVYIDLVNCDEAQARELLLAGINAKRAKPASAPSFPGTAKYERTIAERPNFPVALPRVRKTPQRNPNFTGRSELLAELDRTLTNKPISGLKKIAIYGLGGVGKTQLAVEYAHRHAADYDVIWWVRAEKIDTLELDFAALATKLELPEKDERELPVIIEAVQHWLAQTSRWLLVFDNARDPKALHEYLPQSQSGHIIITSRDVNWGGSTPKKLEVKGLARDESVEFLLNRTNEQDIAAAQALAYELGDLPLALEQAGAYIEATGITLADYLHRFRQHQREMLQRGKHKTDYPATVAKTWELSFKQMLPPAAELMNLCAFLAPEAIPQWLLRDAINDDLAFDDAISALRRYSLIDVDATTRTFAIHRLVQAV